MAVYPPPNFEEYLSVFNPTNWIAEAGSGVDTAFLNANYLKFPVAQGTETLVDTTVNGDLTIANKIIYPNGNTQNTAPITRVEPIPNDGSDFTFTTACAGAINILTSTHTAADRNVFFPVFASIYNNSTITVINETATNIILGTSPSLSSNIFYTGIFGNDEETIRIPPNQQITFFYDGTSYDVISKGREVPLYLTTATNTFTNDCYIGYSSLIYTNAAAGTIALTNFAGVAPNSSNNLRQLLNSTINITNTSDFNLTLNTPTGTFGGQFGTSNTTYIVFPKQTIQLFVNSQTSTYDVVSRSSVASIALTYAELTTILGTGTTIRSYIGNNLTLTGTGTTVFSGFPNASAGRVINKTTRIFNSGIATISLVCSSSTFTGAYGTTTTTLVIPDGSWVDLTSDGTNWIVATRSTNPLFPLAPGATLFIGDNKSYFDSTLSINPSTNTTITIAIASSAHSRNYFIVNRSSSNNITLSLPSTFFTGLYGGDGTTTTTTVISPNCTLKLFSNGNVWNCYERGGSANYSVSTTTATSSIGANYYLYNSTIRFSCTQNLTYTIGLATLLAHTTSFKNNSLFSITLSIAGGTFGGIYGTGGTTFLIPASGSATVSSNGSAYEITACSKNNRQIFLTTPTLDWSNNFSHCETETIIQAPDGGLNTASTFTATATLGAGGSGAFNIMTVNSLGSGFINVGSVIPSWGSGSNSGNRFVVISQLTGTAGGSSATYLVSPPTESSLSGAISGYSNPNAVCSGTLTQTIPVAGGTDTPSDVIASRTGSGLLTAGSVISCNVGTDRNPYHYILGTQNGGEAGTYLVSAAVSKTGAPAATPYYGTQGSRINLPLPTVAVGRSYRFTNVNQIPVYISTAGETAVFGGKFGQQIAYGGSPAVQYSTNYLLRPGKTVELVASNGIWNATYATQSAVVFTNSSQMPIPGTSADYFYNPIDTLYGYNFNDGNTGGLKLYAGGGGIVNASGYPITVLVSMVVIWNANGVSTSSVLPFRTIRIIRSQVLGGTLSLTYDFPSAVPGVSLPNIPSLTVTGTATGGASPYTVAGSTSIVPPVTQNFVISRAANTSFAQSLGPVSLFLNPGEILIFQEYKVNGASTNETIAINNAQITIQRID